MSTLFACPSRCPKFPRSCSSNRSSVTRGSRGERGARGSRGPRGASGTPGSSGAQGAAGATGATGPSGGSEAGIVSFLRTATTGLYTVVFSSADPNDPEVVAIAENVQDPNTGPLVALDGFIISLSGTGAASATGYYRIQYILSIGEQELPKIQGQENYFQLQQSNDGGSTWQAVPNGGGLWMRFDPVAVNSTVPATGTTMVSETFVDLDVNDQLRVVAWTNGDGLNIPWQFGRAPVIGATLPAIQFVGQRLGPIPPI